MEIEPPQHVGQHLDRHHPHGDGVAAAQPLDDGGGKVRPAQPQFVGQAFGGGIKGSEMIARRVDHVDDGVEASRRRGGGGDPRGFGLEADQRMGDAGGARRQLAQFAARHVDAGQPRIGEHPRQFVGKPGAVVAGQAFQVEVVGSRQLEQERRRQRALIALDKVEIAHRNPEIARHPRLRQPARRPHPADTRPGEQFAPGIVGRRGLGRRQVCHNFYSMTNITSETMTFRHDLLTESLDPGLARTHLPGKSLWGGAAEAARNAVPPPPFVKTVKEGTVPCRTRTISPRPMR